MSPHFFAWLVAFTLVACSSGRETELESMPFVVEGPRLPGTSSFVATDERIVFGAPWSHAPEENGTSRGKVLLYRGDGSSFGLEVVLEPSLPSAGFGRQLAARGDRIAVGNSGDNHGGAGVDFSLTGELVDRSGMVAVFAADARGGWHEEVLIKASDAQPRRRFGENVGLSGDLLLVADSPEGLDGVSQLYVYQHGVGGWVERKLLSREEVSGRILDLAVGERYAFLAISAEHGAAKWSRFDLRTLELEDLPPPPEGRLWRVLGAVGDQVLISTHEEHHWVLEADGESVVRDAGPATGAAALGPGGWVMRRAPDGLLWIDDGARELVFENEWGDPQAPCRGRGSLALTASHGFVVCGHQVGGENQMLVLAIPLPR